MKEQPKIVVRSSLISGNAIFFIFLALKLSNVIAWSWWWVTCPLWLPMAVTLSILLGLAGMMAVAGMITMLGYGIQYLLKGRK